MTWVFAILSFLHLGVHEGITWHFGRNDGQERAHWACRFPARQIQTPLALNLGPLGAVVASPTLPCGTLLLIWLPRTSRFSLAAVEDVGPRVGELDLWDDLAGVLEHNGRELTRWIVLPVGGAH